MISEHEILRKKTYSPRLYEFIFLDRIVRDLQFTNGERWPRYERTLTRKALYRRKPKRFPVLFTEFELVRYLLDEGIVTFINLEPETLTFVIEERKRLQQLYDRALIRNIYDEDEPAEVYYNPHSGDIIFNGVRRKLKGRNKKIFTLLYNNMNEQLDKGKIWRAAGRRGKPSGLDDTWTFNSYITNLRRAVGGASPQHIRLDKTVQLWATVKLTDKNDLII